MEPITLITTAFSLISPYLSKTGEKVAEKIGENVWNMLQKPFSKEKKEKLFPKSPNEEELKKIKEELLITVQNNEPFKNELIKTITEAETTVNQQNIKNEGTIVKQINIQTNIGDLNF